MRSSRRNLGLGPEFNPEPTPPTSDDDNFIGDFEIETTIEEEERYRKEDNNEVVTPNNNEDDSVDTVDVVNKDKTNDIVFSSESSADDESSDKSIKIMEKDKVESKSSENLVSYSLLCVIYSTNVCLSLSCHHAMNQISW